MMMTTMSAKEDYFADTSVVAASRGVMRLWTPGNGGSNAEISGKTNGSRVYPRGFHIRAPPGTDNNFSIAKSAVAHQPRNVAAGYRS